jgi:hypothetical protein
VRKSTGTRSVLQTGERDDMDAFVAGITELACGKDHLERQLGALLLC